MLDSDDVWGSLLMIFVICLFISDSIRIVVVGF